MVDLSKYTPEELRKIEEKLKLMREKEEELRRRDEERAYQKQLDSAKDPFEKRELRFKHDHAKAYTMGSRVVSLGDNKEYESLCAEIKERMPFMSLGVGGLLIWGIMWNFLFFWLYRWTLGTTMQEFEEKKNHAGFGTAFALIIILNLILFALLFLPAQTFYHMAIYNVEGERQPWYKFGFGGLFYLLFYGWLGGLRNRCTTFFRFLPAFAGGFLLSFSGLFFYLMSLH